MRSIQQVSKEKSPAVMNKEQPTICQEKGAANQITGERISLSRIKREEQPIRYQGRGAAKRISGEQPAAVRKEEQPAGVRGEEQLVESQESSQQLSGERRSKLPSTTA